MNPRRKLVLATGAGALTAPFASWAQQPGRIWRVGFLSQNRASDFSPFTQRMRELGYVEGKNLII